MLAKIFDGFGLQPKYKIGKYRVDYCVSKLLLILELDEKEHSGDDIAEEEEREKALSKHYTIIRFKPETEIETLMNAILKAQMKEVIRLY